MFTRLVMSRHSIMFTTVAGCVLCFTVQVQGLGLYMGFRVQGLGFRVQRFRVQCFGFRIQGLGFRVQDLGLRVQGLTNTFRVCITVLLALNLCLCLIMYKQTYIYIYIYHVFTLCFELCVHYFNYFTMFLIMFKPKLSYYWFSSFRGCGVRGTALRAWD